jgi:hypothetical protein
MRSGHVLDALFYFFVASINQHSVRRTIKQGSKLVKNLRSFSGTGAVFPSTQVKANYPTVNLFQVDPALPKFTIVYH